MSSLDNYINTVRQRISTTLNRIEFHAVEPEYIHIDFCDAENTPRISKIWSNRLYAFDPNTLARKKECLRRWGSICGFDSILNATEANKYNVINPSDVQCEINNDLLSKMDNMDVIDQMSFGQMYIDDMSSNTFIVRNLPLSTHESIIEWLQQRFPANTYNIDDIHANIVNYHNVNRSVQIPEPLVDDDDDKNDYNDLYFPVEKSNRYFPTGSSYWFKTWLQWLYGHLGRTYIIHIIKEWHDSDGLTGKKNAWYPRSFKHLHKLHMKCLNFCKLTHITERNQFNMLTSMNDTTNVNSNQHKWTYDSWISDLQLFYQSKAIRKSLMASIDDFRAVKKNNPIHLNQPDGEDNYGSFHPSMTRFARSPLFFWLENVTFIKDHIQDSPFPQTRIVTSGTFLFNDRTQIYGICVKVINKYWSIKFVKNKIQKLIELAQDFHDDWQHIFDSAAAQDFDALSPIVNISFLPLHWQFQNCHDIYHQHHITNDQTLWLDVTNVESNDLSCCFINLQIDDDFTIGSVNVGNIWRLMDLNIDDYADDRPLDPIWHWKYVFNDNVAMNPFGFLPVHQFMYLIIDPLTSIMPGIPQQPNLHATVFLGQFNCDGFAAVKYENTITPKQSVSQNYITPLHCLTGNKLLISLGVITEMGDNGPWIDCFVVDCIRALFLGVNVSIRDSRNDLTIFGMIASFLLDGKEVKSMSGIAGANNLRYDYYTMINKHQSHFDLVTQPELHYSVLLTQKHINYLRELCNIFGNVACTSHASQNDIRNIARHNSKIIQTILRYAGISPSHKPKIEKLPTLTLIKVEFCHLMFHHILPRLCRAVKLTFRCWHSNKHIKNYLELGFTVLKHNPYFPAKFNSTYLRNSTQGSKVTMKAIHVYASALMLAYNGIALGFDPCVVILLQRVIQWIGKFLSGCMNPAMEQSLKTECMNICGTIENNQHVLQVFGQSPCLRWWRNLMFVDMFTWNIPYDYIGFMYEGAHKPTLHLLTQCNNRKDLDSINHYNERQRTIKNVHATLVGSRADTDDPTLGVGLCQILPKVKTQCRDWSKMVFWEWNDDDSLSNIEHVLPMDNKKITSKFLHTVLFDFDRLTIHKNNQALQPRLLNKYGYDIANILLSVEHRKTNESNAMKLINAISDSNVDMYVCHGCSTFNLSYLDSYLRRGKIAWFRQPDQDDVIMETRMFVGFRNLHTSYQYKKCFNNKLTQTPHDFLLVIGPQWYCPFTPRLHLNYEDFDIQSSPTICAGRKTSIISAEYAIQQLMMIHDHILPCKRDLRLMSQLFSFFPTSAYLHYPDRRYNLHEYCGPYWVCHKQHAKLNCQQHANDVHEYQLKYDFKCQYASHPYYKAYGFPQGLLNRLVHTKNIHQCIF